MAIDAPLYTRFIAVAPDDTADQPKHREYRPIGLYVGVGGDVSVANDENVSVTFSNVPSGTILPILFRRINAVGTSASNLLALFEA